MSLTRIASRDNALMVRLRRLSRDPDAYRKFGQVLIEGPNLCAAYLARGGTVPQAIISETGWAEPALQQLARRAAAVAVVPEALLAGVSGLESPAALAFVLTSPAPRQLRPGVPTVVLDRLQDPGNVGAILRSAAAFGFAQVLALKGTAALWAPKVVRAGMGAHFGLHLVEGLDAAALERLALPLLATSSHAVEALDAMRLPWPCAWVIGHEGAGVAATLLQRCSQTLRIPQPGGEESLNAAAAAAICLYESTRQRTTIGSHQVPTPDDR